ncbi:MAG: tail fiber domain-containing protein [Bacteroidota bacterium]|nr:tail fiber domain-containing protein [Bacteroidota bacterium]
MSFFGGGSQAPLCFDGNTVVKVDTNGDFACTQIYDTGTNVGVGTSSPSSKFTVNGDIRSLTNTFLSDKRYKKNIQRLDGSLDKILNLQGKTYYWRTEEFNDMGFNDKKQYGFIAQEVAEYFPELAQVDSNGDYALNYTGLIPVLVEALKEQQVQITELSNLILAMSKEGQSIKNKDESDGLIFSTNYPNPFSDETNVDFLIPANIHNATLALYDGDGNVIMEKEIKARNKRESIIIEKGNMKSGVYFYTLLLDGKVYDTKKMIVR